VPEKNLSKEKKTGVAKKFENQTNKKKQKKQMKTKNKKPFLIIYECFFFLLILLLLFLCFSFSIHFLLSIFKLFFIAIHLLAYLVYACVWSCALPSLTSEFARPFNSKRSLGIESSSSSMTFLPLCKSFPLSQLYLPLETKPPAANDFQSGLCLQ
jgi:cation transport ATPase